MITDQKRAKRRRLIALYILFLALLGSTMAGTLIDLGALKVPVRLAVTFVMTMVVATTFMTFKQDSPWLRLLVVISSLWIMFLLVFALANFLTR